MRRKLWSRSKIQSLPGFATVKKVFQYGFPLRLDRMEDRLNHHGRQVVGRDANKKVYVYSTSSGSLLGAWGANSLPKTSSVEGITVWGNDVWIVDAASDKIYRYANAASRTSGSQNATSSFALHANNIGPKDLVTDGVHFWVVDDQVLDRVYKYTLSGTYVSRWDIDPANASPTGITLDPANPGHLWIVDNGTDRVYQYDYALSRSSGSQLASISHPLAAGNTNPQGIADPPAQVRDLAVQEFHTLLESLPPSGVQPDSRLFAVGVSAWSVDSIAMIGSSPVPPDGHTLSGQSVRETVSSASSLSVLMGNSTRARLLSQPNAGEPGDQVFGGTHLKRASALAPRLHLDASRLSDDVVETIDVLCNPVVVDSSN